MFDRRTFLSGLAAMAMARSQSATTGEYDVRSAGARGDGHADDTKAIQSAIDACAKTGGRVVFPPGDYRTGMVRLKSHVSIDLRNRAVWRAIPDLSLFPPVAPRSFAPAFLFAENEEDIHISGDGKIHGSGEAHDVFIPGPNLTKGPRPYGLLFRNCRNLSLSGVTLESSGFWMLRPENCDDVVIRGIRIHNHANLNNDGIDVVDCHRVIIADCILDCEDDAICLKSESSRGVLDVAVSNCVVSSHASALKLGTASRGAFNRIAFSNCIVKPSRERKTLHPHQLVDGIAGIDLMSTDGGVLTNVSFNNIVMDGVQTPFFIRLGNRHSTYPLEAGERTAVPRAGSVENVSIANVQAVNAGVVACSISGYPGHYVQNVKLSNIDLAFKGAGTEADVTAEVPEKSATYPFPMMFGKNLPAYGLYLRHVRDISINGLLLRPPAGEPRPDLVADDVHGMWAVRLRTGHPGREKPQVKTTNCTGVQLA